jgi:hypothetical protein
LDEWRLVDAELNVGAELDVAVVASVELIVGADLGSAELAGNKQLAGGSVGRAQRRRVDRCWRHGAQWQHGALRRQRARSLPAARRERVGMAVTHVGQIGAQVRDGEEMHMTSFLSLLP